MVHNTIKNAIREMAGEEPEKAMNILEQHLQNEHVTEEHLTDVFNKIKEFKSKMDSIKRYIQRLMDFQQFKGRNADESIDNVISSLRKLRKEAISIEQMLHKIYVLFKHTEE